MTAEQKDKLEKFLDVIDANPATIKEVNRSEDEFPKQGDEYYYINSYGEIHSDKIIDLGNIINRNRIGNIFKTRAEAEFELERLKVIAEMKRFGEPIDLNAWAESLHYYIEYNTDTNRLGICKVFYYTYIDSTIYFDSRQAAKECINEVGEDRIKKYYLGIS